MTAPEPLRTHQPQATFSTWFGVVLLFAFFGLLALVVFRAAPRGTIYEEKRNKDRTEKFQAAQKQAFTALTTYGWVDKNKGVVRIPITDAMKLTVAELAEKKPAAANPIVIPAPVAAPGTSPATSPAAGATATPAGSPSATPAMSATPATPAATATPVSTDKPSSVTGPDSEIRAQPAAAANPPGAPPGTQPGPSTTPASSPPSAPAKAQASPSPSPSPSPPGTPLPVRGKTP